MGRRRNKDIYVEFFRMLTDLPWWISLICAALFFIGFVLILGSPWGVPLHDAFSPLCVIIGLFFSVGCLACAGISVFKKYFRGRLLDSQSGLPSIRSLSWRDFERLVGEAYRRQGYFVEEVGGGGADGGVDLILHKNGEDTLVQCKQWKTWKVGVKPVRELFGVMTARRARHGILICSDSFTDEAERFAGANGISLVAGQQLEHLIRSVQSQATTSVALNSTPRPASIPPALPTTGPTLAELLTKPANTSQSQSTVPTCPHCGASMLLRTARRGARAGQQFWGCSTYPACKGIKQVADIL